MDLYSCIMNVFILNLGSFNKKCTYRSDNSWYIAMRFYAYIHLPDCNLQNGIKYFMGILLQWIVILLHDFICQKSSQQLQRIYSWMQHFYFSVPNYLYRFESTLLAKSI